MCPLLPFCESSPELYFFWDEGTSTAEYAQYGQLQFYSDPVFSALLSILFLIITNILFSSFDCCWAPTWCFQRAIYQTPLSSRDHYREIIFFFPMYITLQLPTLSFTCHFLAKFHKDFLRFLTIGHCPY